MVQFPPALEKLQNLEKWEGIFQSGNFVKTGKVREFYWKVYWKSQGNLSASNSENPANMVPYLKNTGKVGGKSGKFVSLKKWEPWIQVYTTKWQT